MDRRGGRSVPVPCGKKRFRGIPFFRRGNGNIGKGCAESELSPFEFPHFMIREEFHAADAAEILQKGRQLFQAVSAEGPAGKKHMADPDLFPGLFAVFESGEFVLIVLPGEFAAEPRIQRLDVEQEKIRRIDRIPGPFQRQGTCGVQCGMESRFPAKL